MRFFLSGEFIMPIERMYDNSDNYFEQSKRTWAIFLISVLGLFLEMLLIRWIGTEIRIFAYLQNTILVACFLGLGLGCFTSHQPIILRQSLIPLTVLLVLMAIPISRSFFGQTSEFLSVLGDLVIWGDGFLDSGLLLSILFVILGLALTYALLIVIVDIFVPIGRLLARLLDEHPNTIWAYSVNIAGSLAGTWLFVLVSYFYQPPFTWFVIAGGLMLIFVIWSQHDKRINFALIGGVIVLSWFAGLVPGMLDVIWSPYQKLVVEKVTQQDGVGSYRVTVNNTGYQAMIDLSESHTLSDRDKFPFELHGLSQYDIPLLIHPKPQTYLIVGAGTGNDAAGGVRHGVNKIIAVEIDPAIISIGRSFHPEQPYSSSTVQVVNDDARSFFATTSEKFDVISFSLLDSHTTTAMTNARLDHYVYTQESIARAKSLLADGGIMVLTFEAQKPFIADRMARVLQESFGEKPIFIRMPGSQYGWGGVMFISGDLDSARKQIAQNQRLGAYINQLQQQYPLSLSYTTKVATDDWPYIYLDSPKIPVLYYLLAGLMLLVLYRSSKKWRALDIVTRWHRSHWHFFFLGAAFLLLEVQNISKASVVLGNTWETNAVIVSGVLVMVLVANLIAHKFPKLQINAVYMLLIGIALALYFVDLAQFAFLPYAAKILVVGGLTTLPMIFSGIIFIKSFACVAGKDEALGANMVGSIVGALIQSVTFAVGIKALLLIVAGLYILSVLTRPRQLRSALPLLQKSEA
jgi:spermidine synthase